MWVRPNVSAITFTYLWRNLSLLSTWTDWGHMASIVLHQAYYSLICLFFLRKTIDTILVLLFAFKRRQYLVYTQWLDLLLLACWLSFSQFGTEIFYQSKRKILDWQQFPLQVSIQKFKYKLSYVWYLFLTNLFWFLKINLVTVKCYK